MIRPMTMANGVDTRRIFLAGCMELAVSYRIVSKGRATIYQSSPVAVARWGVGPGRREKGARAEATTKVWPPLAEAARSDHVHLSDLLVLVTEHASRAPLSATKVRPFAPVAEAAGERFCVHRTPHAGLTPVRDTLLGGQTPITAEPAHPRSAKSHMAHPRPLSFCPFVHSSRPSFTSQRRHLLSPPPLLILLCRAAPNKLS